MHGDKKSLRKLRKLKYESNVIEKCYNKFLVGESSSISMLKNGGGINSELLYNDNMVQ